MGVDMDMDMGVESENEDEDDQDVDGNETENDKNARAADGYIPQEILPLQRNKQSLRRDGATGYREKSVVLLVAVLVFALGGR